MKKLLVLFFISVTFLACSNDADVNNETEEAVTNIDAEMAPTTNVAMAPLSGLFNFLQENDSLFSPDFFQEFSEPVPLDTLTKTPIDQKHLSQYTTYFIFNEDSSLALDPYSYSFVLVNRNNQTKLTAGSPDTEVGLVDYKNGMRQRLFYFGPSYQLIDARWNSPKTVLVAVTEMIAPNKISPEIWEVNVTNYTKKISRYPDTLTFDIDEYRKQKLTTTQL